MFKYIAIEREGKNWKKVETFYFAGGKFIEHCTNLLRCWYPRTTENAILLTMFIVQELLETESNYVEVLNMLRKHFIRPVSSIKVSSPPSIDQSTFHHSINHSIIILTGIQFLGKNKVGTLCLQVLCNLWILKYIRKGDFLNTKNFSPFWCAMVSDQIYFKIRMYFRRWRVCLAYIRLSCLLQRMFNLKNLGLKVFFFHTLA